VHDALLVLLPPHSSSLCSLLSSLSPSFPYATLFRSVLFDRLGLQPSKKTKTGYSTDASSLEKLRGQHPIIEHLLRYREVEKLRRSEEHTSELQSRENLVCRLLLDNKHPFLDRQCTRL